MTKRVRRTFTDEFKAQTVALIERREKPRSHIAKDLGIGESVITRWVKQAAIDGGRGPTGALTTEERQELGRLRKENRILLQEREILKKAAAFFAKESK